MKGLLTKDFALLGQRKRIFLILAAWAVLMCYTMEDGSFIIGWMTVIAAFFAISSLTYDEYDHCLPCLMSLPITGKIYVREKFLFGFLCGFAAWVFAVTVWIVFSSVRGIGTGAMAVLAQVSVFIPVFMLLIDFSLPLHLKYGSERGRIIVLIVWGIAVMGILAVNKLLHADLTPVVGLLTSPRLLPAAFALVAALTVISLLLCTRIMEKKEF